MLQLSKTTVILATIACVSISFVYPSNRSKFKGEFLISPADYLSMKVADSLLRNLFVDLPTNKGLWYTQVDFLRNKNYVLDYFKPSNATSTTTGVINDSLFLLNVGVSPSSKLILSSSARKIRLTSTSPIITDNLAVSLYMETSELSVYNNWVNDISIFTSYTRIKSQNTPFDETWGILYNDPKFQYYTVTYKILNESRLDRISSVKPIVYAVELRRFYKP